MFQHQGQFRANRVSDVQTAQVIGCTAPGGLEQVRGNGHFFRGASTLRNAKPVLNGQSLIRQHGQLTRLLAFPVPPENVTGRFKCYADFILIPRRFSRMLRGDKTTICGRNLADQRAQDGFCRIGKCC